MSEKENILEKEQTNEKTSELLYIDVKICSSLIKEWDQFDQMIKNQNDSQNILTPEFPAT